MSGGAGDEPPRDEGGSDVTSLTRERQKLWAEYHAERPGPSQALAEHREALMAARAERNTFRGGDALRRRRRR